MKCIISIKKIHSKIKANYILKFFGGKKLFMKLMPMRCENINKTIKNDYENVLYL